MIIGHCENSERVVRFIYLFHIPLFFLLSGYFYKERTILSECKKGARTLLLPYLVGVVVVLLKYCTDVLRGIDISLLKHFIVTAIVVGPKVNLCGYEDLQVGAIWFLPALFFCRVIFQTIRSFFQKIFVKQNGECAKNFLCVLVMLLSLLCSILLRDGPSVFGIGQAFAGLFFYAVGVILAMAGNRGLKKWEKHFSLVCGLSFLSIFFVDSLDLYTMKFPVYWSQIMSVCAIIFLMRCALGTERKMPGISRILSIVGRGSLLLLLIHYFEMMTFDWKRVAFLEEFLPFVRLAIDLVIFAILNRISIVKKILNLS